MKRRDRLYLARLRAIRATVDGMEARALRVGVILPTLSPEERRRHLAEALFRHYREGRGPWLPEPEAVPV